jgi:hypothetical protein
MKSEKARQELDDGSWKVEVNCEGEEFDLPYHAVRVDVAQYAVELAEQEAEERMREKAIEVHRKVCFFRNFKDNTCANTATKCGEHSCHYMNYLIQKLNEE